MAAFITLINLKMWCGTGLKPARRPDARTLYAESAHLNTVRSRLMTVKSPKLDWFLAAFLLESLFVRLKQES